MQAHAKTYHAVEGDTLSTIASFKIPRQGPLYGVNGRLARIIASNPHIANPDQILIGTEIVLPVSNDDFNQPVRGLSSDEAVQLQNQAVNSTETIIAKETQSLPSSAQEIKKSEVPGEDSKEDLRQWGMGVGAGISYLRIDSEDTLLYGNATLLSDTGIYLRASAYQLWSESFKTFQELSLASYRFINVKTGQSLKNPGLVNEIRFGIENSLSEGWKLQTSLGVRQTLFIKTADGFHYEFEKIPVSFIKLSSRHTLLKKNNLSLVLAPEAEYLSSASSSTINVDSGWGAGIELGTEYNKKEKLLKTALAYKRLLQNADISKQKQTELIFGLSYQAWVF